MISFWLDLEEEGDVRLRVVVPVGVLVKRYGVDVGGLSGWVEVGYKVDQIFFVLCHHYVRKLWFDQVEVVSFLEQRMIWLVIH